MTWNITGGLNYFSCAKLTYLHFSFPSSCVQMPHIAHSLCQTGCRHTILHLLKDTVCESALFFFCMSNEFVQVFIHKNLYKINPPCVLTEGITYLFIFFQINYAQLYKAAPFKYAEHVIRITWHDRKYSFCSWYQQSSHTLGIWRCSFSVHLLFLSN